MKDVEMMENDPKAAAAQPTGCANSAPGASPHADQFRRRFVRGAAAAAPLVLTLRSGALAAASCVGGGMPRTVTLLANGEIPAPAQSTDRCFSSVNTCSADSNKIDGGIPLGGTGGVSSVFPSAGSGFKCDGGVLGQNVAILSGSSATSLGVN